MFSHEPKHSLVCILNHHGSIFDSTWVVVGLLASSDFTSSRGTSFPTFVTHLQKIHVALSIFQHITNGVGLYLRISAKVTSLRPRITSSSTSSTEKPNRSSNSGVFLQQRPEANNCQTGKRPRVRNTKQKTDWARIKEKQSKLKRNVIKSLLLI